MSEPRKVVKKWVVDSVKHHAWPDSEVPISVDPKEGGFWLWCPILGEVKAPTRKDLKRIWRNLYTQARAPETEWKQIIVVKRVNTDTYRDDEQVGMYVGFEQIIRIERAIVTYEYEDKRVWGNKMRTAKTTLYRRFGAATEADGDPTTAENTYQGFNAHQDRERVPLYGAQIIPYTKEAWQTLMAMKDALRQMNRRINDLMAGEAAEVAERLGAMTGPLQLTGGDGS